MSEPIDDGGPAFPGLPSLISASEFVDGDRTDKSTEFDIHDEYLQCGMSLRDWFAGQAIISFRIQFSSKLEPENAQLKEAAEKTALYAYKIADAMLAARKS